MPLLVSPQEYTRQCIHAAYASRLNPYVLHIGEHRLLSTRLDETNHAIYLQLRNGILRLWTRNPLVCVTKDEALLCAKESAHARLASFAHEWLSRHGYINFGCVDIPQQALRQPTYLAKQKTIIIVGAGVSGLACARQIKGLVNQFQERWTKNRKERIPRIVILEGRGRIGGRVYSHPLRNQKHSLPDGLANTAEMGAQIITGFEHGNPLNAIVRGQLALRYHSMRDNMVLYDFDGTIVDEKRDTRIQTMFNDMLETVSAHRWQAVHKLGPTTNGFLMETSKGPLSNGNHFILPVAAKSEDEKDGTNGMQHPTLGALMDYLVAGYQNTAGLTHQDLRLINWHYANMEYANAVNVDQLSLGGWDQDQENEFEGRHSIVVGGYTQLPRALWKYPTRLDVKLRKKVVRILHRGEADAWNLPTRVECQDGDVIEADYIVNTLPLGVLKEGSITFEPSLPSWKQGAIQRLGFGLLNKVVMVFDQVFWERDRDMFGFLNIQNDGRGLAQEDYVQNRGRFYLFWNCIKTSGVPMLVALMAGEAAHQVEEAGDQELVLDVTNRLAAAFGLSRRPIPTEAIVTRWKRDPFARGSYSYLGPAAQPGDYDAMAKPLGNLFFAGEATCGTHPATVHGAYISGLRAAAEVVEAMIGDIPFS